MKHLLKLQPSRYCYPRSAGHPAETGKAAVESITGKSVTEVAASADNAKEATSTEVPYSTEPVRIIPSTSSKGISQKHTNNVIY